jgi:hypothetical protein
MIVFKNRKGSLLIEAVFALCIAATLLIPLFSSLAILVERIGFSNQKAHAFFQAKHFFQTTLFQKSIADQKEKVQTTQTEKLENGTMLVYSEQPVNQKSVFKGNPYLVHIIVSYTWESALKDGFNAINVYVFEIPQEKKQ